MPRRPSKETLDHLCNCGTLRKATRRISLHYDEVLQPSGLKLSQYQLLSHVGRATLPPKMRELADALVLDPSALAHNMKPLERDGYVLQIRDQFDGRSRRATLTPLGKKKLLECQRLWGQAQKRFERAYGSQRSRDLAKALSELFSDRFSEAFFRDAIV